MAVGENRQSRLSSLGLNERTFTALWGVPYPEGPCCFLGSSALQAFTLFAIPSLRIYGRMAMTSGQFRNCWGTGMQVPQWCIPTSSIEGIEVSVAQPMHSARAQIVCSPNRIRLTAAVVFTGQQRSWRTLTSH